jgi:hypothetical protein
MIVNLAYIIRSKVIFNKKYIPLVIFFMGCLVRVIPELVAYPYPIGYDVVNYYIPVVTNFWTHWSVVSGQFPLYVLFLHFVNIASGLDPYLTVVTFCIIVFGLFAVSVFFVGQRLFGLGISYSIFLTVFVIFQLAILRTTWDLHRDVFALSTTFLTFSLIYKIKQKVNWSIILVAMTLSAASAVADGLNGSLFVFSLLIYTVLTKTRIALLCTLVSTTLFAFSVLPDQNILHKDMEIIPRGFAATSLISTSYNPFNLLILFSATNGPLIPTGVIGFKAMKNSLLKIPWLISLLASFSWVIFPSVNSLAADRWIILSAIYLSIFSAYGIIHVIQRLNIHAKTVITTIFLSIITVVITTGIAYEIMPNDKPLNFYGIARNYVETFVPVTMQINSVDTRQTAKIISAFFWINNNTEANAKIVGYKDWRGWMELELKGNRTFAFSDNLIELVNTIKKEKNSSNYLVMYSSQKINNSRLSLVYSNDIFKVFRID